MSDDKREAIGAADTETADTVAAGPVTGLGATLTDPGAADRQDAIDAEVEAEVEPLRQAGDRDYRVESEIARGGMGRILRARDRRHRRPVALKEMLGVSAASRARFEREALITARLQHPGIVPVYELARWRSGEPFYAMKLVEGRSLSAAIEAAATTEERLALLPKVIAAVDAIAYAHQQRVIHRDLKPSNILVGGFGETVVVDWGLAKDLEAAGDETDAAAGSTDSELTRAGSVMGTPVYMPVEQARGEPLDERADVYALGAILYHLIAGVPPYRARTADDVLELVRDKPPIGIGELEVDVPDDLVAIVEVAMARDREDRYPSGVELAAELERFSTGQLVGAHRYSAWALVRRWMARHRAAVITALVGLVALAAVSLFMVREILEERDAARAARADAELQRQRAEGLVDFMLADLRGKLAPAGQMALLENVAERAGAYANKVPDEVDGAIDRRRRVAELVGDVRTSTGDLEGAERAFRSELELARQLAAREGNEAAQKAIAAAHRHIAEALAERGERSAALEELEDATEALAGLPREIAADVLGKIRSTEGTIRFLDRDIDGAREAFEIAGELLGADWERRGKPADAALGVLQIEGRLADIDLATGRPAAALERYDKLIDGIDQAPAPEGFRSYIRAKLGLKRGNALAALDRDDEALAAFAGSAAIVERLSRDDPENHSLLYDRSVALANQVDHLEARPGVAAARLREAIGVMKRAVDGSDNAEWQGHLGALHGRLGELLAEKRRPGARAELERAVEILGALEASGRLVEVEGHRAALERARQALSEL